MDEHLLEKFRREYISSKEASKLFGVTYDYIARLCRQGKLRGVLEGRSWWVERKSLKEFFGSAGNVAPVAVPVAPHYLTSREAARMYRVSHDYVSRLCRQGKLAGRFEDGAWMVDKEDLTRFFAHRKPSMLPTLFEQQNYIAPVPVVSPISPVILAGKKVEIRAPRFKKILIIASIALCACLFFSDAAMSQFAQTQTGQAAALGVLPWIETISKTLGSIFGFGSRVATTAPPSAASLSSAGAQTVVNNSYKTYNTTNNNTYNSYAPATVATSAGVSEDELNQKINALRSEVFNVSSASSGTLFNDIAITQRIDTLNNVTVHGISGIQASEIPDLSAEYLAVAGGTLTGLINDTSPDTSTFSGPLSVDSLIVSTTTATSTFADGVNLTSGCFSVGGVCITGGGGGGSGTPGGSDTEVQFNNGGSFAGSAAFTFNTTTNQLSATNIVLTNSTTTHATSTSFFATTASTTNFAAEMASITSLVAGTLSLDTPLGLGSGGTGTSTAPAYGQVLLGNKLGGYDLIATSSLGITGGGSVLFSYLFPNNATSTQIGFNGGLTAMGATTSALAVTGSSTVSGVFDSLSSNLLASTTLFGNTLFGNATSTNLVVSGTASTTRLYGADLSNCNSGNVLTWANGDFGCAVDQTSTGEANTFAFLQNFGQITAATSSPIWAQGGIFASSTSEFVNAFFTGGATTSALAVTGSTTISGVLNAESTINGGTLNLTNALGVGSGGTGQQSFTASQLLYGNGTNALAGVGTTSLALSGPFTLSGTLGALVGGQNSTITYTGLATTTQPNSSNLLVSNGGAGVYGVATTSVSCGGGTTCSSFTVLGSSPVTLSSFGYLFPSNATSTQIGFNGGLTAVGATTSALAVTGSSTISGVFNSLSSNLLGSTTLLGTSLFSFATTTNFAITGTPGALLKTLSNGAVVPAIAGVDYAVGGTQNPFSFLSNYNQITAATSSPIWAESGIFASSTSHFSLIDFGNPGQSTSTLLSVNGRQFLNASSSAGNLFLGLDSGAEVANSIENTGFGYQALQNASSTNNNTAVGFGALTGSSTNFTGSDNTAVGRYALNGVTTGFQETAVGENALGSSTANYQNDAFGYNSQAANTGGGNDASFGLNALEYTVSGSQNTAIGEFALQNTITGNNSTAVGFSALSHNGSATTTVAVGAFAAAGVASYNNQNGVYVGYSSGYSAHASSDYNTFIGFQSGYNNTTGYDNILLGPQVNQTVGPGSLTTGGGNIGIGFNVLFPSGTANNQLNIGNFLFGTLPATTSNTSLTLPTSGALGIGTSSPFAKLSIQTNNGDTATTLFAIGSSTSLATTTLFSVSNTGLTTLLGLSATSATTSALAVTGSTTISGVFNSLSSNLLASTTLFGNTLLTNATSTAFAVLGTASTTNLIVSSAGGTPGCATFSANGTISNTGSACGSSSSGQAPFVWNSNDFNTLAAATSSTVDFTSGIFASSTSYIASTTFAINGYVGVGSTTPFGRLSVDTNNLGSSPSFVIGSSTTDFIVQNNGNVGTGTTSPWAQFSVDTSGLLGNTPAFVVGSSTGGTNLIVTNGGLVGIGTTSPSTNYTFSVNGNFFTSGAATSTIQGGLSVQSGALQVNSTSGITSIDSLQTGNINFDTDAGIVSWVDLPVANATNGTVESYTANLAGNPAITVYGVSNGSGNVTNLAVGIGTTSPFQTLSVQGNAFISGGATSTNFAITGTASTTLLYGADLKTCNSGNVLTWSAGNFGCAVDQTSAGGANPFAWATNFGVVSAATTSPIWAQNGIFASSTSQFAAANVYGNLGIGTSTPLAQLQLSALFGTTYPNNNLFAIASSSLSATTTLFSVSNTGVASTSALVVSSAGGTAGCATFSANGTISNTGSACGTGAGGGSAFTFQAGPFNQAIVAATSSVADFTSGLFASSTSQFAAANFYNNVGIGTSTPWAELSISTTSPTIPSGGPLALFAVASSTNATIFDVLGNGNVGVGTTTPWARLSIDTSGLGASPAFAVGSTTGTDFAITYATTTVYNGFSANNGNIVSDFVTGTTTIANLSTGLLSFDTDAGMVAAFDIPLDAAQAAGTVDSYAFQIGGSQVATVYGENNGSGVLQNARFGIGTTSPETTLTVVGAICAARGAGSQTTACGSTAGEIFAASANTSAGTDVAETYTTSDPTVGPGDIVTFDAMNPGAIMKATATSTFLGAISTTPGLTLGEISSSTRAVALTGRVPIKVDMEGGPIAVGDAITISSIPGVGMKATTTALTVGVALQAATTSESILVFIKPELTFSPSDLSALSQLIAFASSTNTTAPPTGSFMSGFIQNLLSQISQWLSNAANGVGTVFAQSFHAKDTICVDDQCLTKDDIRALLQLEHNGGSSAAPPQTDSGSSTPPTDAGAPVITLLGSNPAQLNVGDPYVDPGVTVSDNVSQNLGYTVSLDGASSTSPDQLTIDTSTPGTHTILYSATDQAGNTGTATRTVVVSDPSATTTPQQ